jgi:hypothetical protein
VPYQLQTGLHGTCFTITSIVAVHTVIIGLRNSGNKAKHDNLGDLFTVHFFRDNKNKPINLLSPIGITGGFCAFTRQVSHFDQKHALKSFFDAIKALQSNALIHKHLARIENSVLLSESFGMKLAPRRLPRLS